MPENWSSHRSLERIALEPLIKHLFSDPTGCNIIRHLGGIQHGNIMDNLINICNCVNTRNREVKYFHLNATELLLHLITWKFEYDLKVTALKIILARLWLCIILSWTIIQVNMTSILSLLSISPLSHSLFPNPSLPFFLLSHSQHLMFPNWPQNCYISKTSLQNLILLPLSQIS